VVEEGRRADADEGAGEAELASKKGGVTLNLTALWHLCLEPAETLSELGECV
jgi:hypothetical protein